MKITVTYFCKNKHNIFLKEILRKKSKDIFAGLLPDVHLGLKEEAKDTVNSIFEMTLETDSLTEFLLILAKTEETLKENGIEETYLQIHEIKN